MKCMCTQPSPRFMLSSERVWGNGVRTHVNSKGKVPSTGGSEEDRTHDPASSRTASPTHYRLRYSGPTDVHQSEDGQREPSGKCLASKAHRHKFAQTPTASRFCYCLMNTSSYLRYSSKNPTAILSVLSAS